MNRFEQWCPVKQDLQNTLPSFHIQEREVWYVHLGANIGFEQNGKGEMFLRPVVVIKKVGNLFFVLPMTTSGKETSFYHTLPDEYFQKRSRIILSQSRMIDKKRFVDKIEMIHKKDFIIIKEKLKELLL